MVAMEDVRAAASRWPNVSVSLETFAAWVGSADANEHLADQFVAWAALERDPDAVQHVREQVRALCPRGLRAAGADGYDVADLEQDVMTSLLVGVPDRSPALSQYAGRGPLGGWLRACVVRRCLMWRRRKSPLHSVAEISDRLIGEDIDAEVHSLRAEDKRVFAEALAKAFANLDRETRALLRYYYLDGLDLAQLGRLHDVHPATISRRLNKARTEILSRTQGALETFGVAEHVWPLVRSRLEVSLGTLLRTL